jgi:phospholipid/cholesterol/gamma-HCH transport system substrate-binding protein
VSENEEAIRDALKNVDTFSQALARNSERLDSLLSGVDILVNKDGTGELQAAVKSFHTLSDNLDTRTADITAGVNKFTANGTKEVSQLIADGRSTLAVISRAFANLDKNPSRLLFGGAPPADATGSTSASSTAKPAATPAADRPKPAAVPARPRTAPATANASADNKPKP